MAEVGAEQMMENAASLRGQVRGYTVEAIEAARADGWAWGRIAASLEMTERGVRKMLERYNGKAAK